MSTVIEPTRDPLVGGRPDSLPEWLRYYAAVIRRYQGWSLRRSEGRFQGLVAQGIIPRVPSYNVPSKLLVSEEATAPLLHLLLRSAAPVAGIETRFAIDGTGMRLDAYGPYMGDKHGDNRKHRYLRLHLIVGCLTNIVVGAIITEEYGDGSGESPKLPLLCEIARKAGFKIEKVTADKAYCSHDNYEYLASIGAQGFIPFKSNDTSASRGVPEWKKMFYFFQLQRATFDKEYHERSLIESTNFAIKAKIGDRIRSKLLTSRVNEALCELIAYNMTVLVHEITEHKIAIPFALPGWKVKAPASDVIPKGEGPAELCYQTPPTGLPPSHP
ncbi:MAG: transposase [Euryarchaeota archaeon]|nr:transposase [Euryarchaeota archaeon]